MTSVHSPSLKKVGCNHGFVSTSGFTVLWQKIKSSSWQKIFSPEIFPPNADQTLVGGLLRGDHQHHHHHHSSMATAIAAAKEASLEIVERCHRRKVITKSVPSHIKYNGKSTTVECNNIFVLAWDFLNLIFVPHLIRTIIWRHRIVEWSPSYYLAPQLHPPKPIA